MTAVSLSEKVLHRLVITRRAASEILVSTGTGPWSLPSVEIVRGERLAGQLVGAVQRDYALRPYCLWSNHSFATPYSVLEAVTDEERSPDGTKWIGRCEAASSRALEPSDQAVVLQMDRELERNVADSDGSPFSRPGWIQDLLTWAEREIAPRKLTGEFEQLHASPTFNLVRVGTTSASVWFKATGKPLAHERAITLTLASLLPDFLPQVIAPHPTWNGWLSEQASGQRLDQSTDGSDWVAAAEGLARMQIASRGVTETILEAGAKRLRLPDLAGEITPFLERTEELMARQTSEPPQILGRQELRDLASSIAEAYQELGNCGWPDTVGHLDANPGNIFVSRKQCSFLDWAEGYVGHPLFTLEYLCEHARQKLGRSETRIESAYLGPWQASLPLDAIERSRAFSPLLAVLAYAVSDGRWRSTELLSGLGVAGHFRSLARRAYREAIRLRSRRNSCAA